MVSEKSSKTKPRRTRKRKARSKSTTSKEQKVVSLPSSFNNSNSNYTFKTGLNFDVKRIWRPKVIKGVSKELSSIESVRRFEWKPKTMLSNVPKLCYSVIS